MEVLRYLAIHPTAFAFACLGLGLIFGSFLNVVIYRLPVMLKRDWEAQCLEFLREQGHWELTEKAGRVGQPERFNLWVPDSRCPNCNHQIKPWENFPILSYLALRGRCSACGSRISVRYPAIELLTGLAAMTVALQLGFGWQVLGALGLTFSLIALTMIDIDELILPDDIVLPLLWAGLLANSFGLFVSLADALLGAIAGYLSLWSVYWGFRLLTGKEGMGYGDFKLLAALGAWLGWQALPMIILLSAGIGALVGVLGIVLKLHDRDKPIPFGPYLAGAGWVALLWGDQIGNTYLRWAGL